MTERVPAGLQTTRPTAAAQKSQTTRARFFIAFASCWGPFSADRRLDAHSDNRVDRGSTLSREPRSGYTFGYGLGSLRSCAWNGGPCGCEDVGNCCRCGDFAESFGRDGSEWRWDGSGEGYGAKTDPRGRTTGGSGRQDDGAGASEQRGFGSRGQTVWGESAETWW